MTSKIQETMEILFKKQRKVFFDRRIQEIQQEAYLLKNDQETLWTMLLAGEHPHYMSEHGHGDGYEILPELQNLNLKEELISTDRILDGFLYQLILTWSYMWKKYQLDNAPMLVARFVLAKEHKLLDDKITNYHSAEIELIKELDKKFKEINTIAENQVYQTIKKANHEYHALFEKDSKAISYLKSMSMTKNVEETIQNLEELNKPEDAKDQRALKWKSPLYFQRIIGKILWRDIVRNRVKLLKEKPPGITLYSFYAISTPLRNKLNVDGNVILNEHGLKVGEIRTTPPKDIPGIDVKTIEGFQAKGNIQVLSSINFHKAFRWQAEQATTQLINGLRDFRRIAVDGGIKEFGHLCGTGTGNRIINELTQIITWQRYANFELPNGAFGPMLTFTLWPSPKDKRKKMLTFYLTDMMLPNYVFDLPKNTMSQRELRMIAPLLKMPPLVGRTNEHGPQASFQLELSVEMRKGAQDLLTKGGIYLPQSKKEELATRVFLPLDLLQRLFDRWTKSGSDGLAMLIEVEKDVYSLNPLNKDYVDAHDFLLESARQEIRASKAGLKSNKRRLKE